MGNKQTVFSEEQLENYAVSLKSIFSFLNIILIYYFILFCLW
jgi:hypothetical protein